MENKENNFDRDVKFSHWLKWYTDLTEEIARIREIGYLVMFEPKQMNHYYSKIMNLTVTVSWALNDPDTIFDRLQKIEDNIFSQKYLQDLDRKTLTDYQRRVIKELRLILKEICEDLSTGGLLPKITKKQKYNPGEAILG